MLKLPWPPLQGYLLGLWLHECRRVFCDKLVTYDDKRWVDKTLTELMRENFQADLVRQVGRGWGSKGQQADS